MKGRQAVTYTLKLGNSESEYAVKGGGAPVSPSSLIPLWLLADNRTIRAVGAKSERKASLV